MVLQTLSEQSPGPVLPHFDKDQWAALAERLSHCSDLVSHFKTRQAEESASALLTAIITSLSSLWRPRHFHALRCFFDNDLQEEEQVYMLEILSRVAVLAQETPVYLTEPLHFLKQGTVKSIPLAHLDTPYFCGVGASTEISLTRKQIACLLACAMFGCIQPLQGELVGVFSVAGIYTGPAKPWMLAKLRLLIAYFDSITDPANSSILNDTVRCAHSHSDVPRQRPK